MKSKSGSNGAPRLFLIIGKALAGIPERPKTELSAAIRLKLDCDGLLARRCIRRPQFRNQHVDTNLEQV